MSCKFSIEFSDGAEKTVAKAQNAITGAGGKFSGDSVGGQFSLSTVVGSVKGEYAILNSTMSIHIQEKPAFIPCGKIEKMVRKYLENQHV